MPVEDAYSSSLDTSTTTLGSAQAALTMNVKGIKSFAIDIPTGLTGTVTFEATLDDTLWHTVSLVNGAGTSVATVTNPAGDIYSAPNYRPAWSQVRARVSTYTSGTTNAISRRHPR